MFSYHLDSRNVLSHFKYSKGFKQFDDLGSVKYVTAAISKYVTSPIVWNHGYRSSSNWKYADWIVLDIDDGLTMESAYDNIKSYTHVMGTTKSHQKSKGGRPPCDRFRVWLKLEGRCEKLLDYSSTVRKWARLLEGDQQAVDGARKFLPCVKIVSARNGNSVRIEEAPRPVIKTFKTDIRRYIPKFIESMLSSGVPDGQRNYSCYVVGKYLTNNGFGVDEVVNMIMSSPIPSAGCHRREVEGAVMRGSRG